MSQHRIKTETTFMQPLMSATMADVIPVYFAPEWQFGFHVEILPENRHATAIRDKVLIPGLFQMAGKPASRRAFLTMPELVEVLDSRQITKGKKL